jgi:penicillin-binding protein 2
MQELALKTKKRLFIIFIMIYSLACLLFIRLFYLQIISGREYYKQAMENRTQIIKIPAYRSIIFDRNGKNKLAFNRRSLSIIATPAYMPDNPVQKLKVLSNVSKLLGMPIDVIEMTLNEQALDKYTPVILKYDIDTKVMVQFKEHYELYPGLDCENRPRRIYPEREKTAQLIGYTGIISKEELKKLKVNKEFHYGSIVGKMGIEKYYDEIIRGKEGIIERVVDVNGNVLEQNIQKEAIPGNAVVLTIDQDIQDLAYDLLGNKTGAIIVSKPASGEILALVSKPSFDPNIFTDRFTLDEFFVLKNNIDKPFLNRAIQGQYPPSSIFKLITASAALKTGVPINKTVNCQGFMWIGNRVFKCWDVHHVQNMIGGIANSCDVYFYTTGLSVGRDEIMHFAQNYGINQKTEIDLPGENIGLLPEMDWFKKKYNRPWQNGDTANISIGQGDLLITPIEMNALTMAIANDGVVMKPHLLQRIVSLSDNTIITNIPNEMLRKIDLSDEEINILKKGMFGVTTFGTAKWIKDASPIPICGKTGTGEAGKEQETHAWFTAFAPYNASNKDDIIAVTVVVEHGGGGSGVAAPIALQIINYYFKNKVIYKNPETGQPVVIRN